MPNDELNQNQNPQEEELESPEATKTRIAELEDMVAQKDRELESRDSRIIELEQMVTEKHGYKYNGYEYKQTSFDNKVGKLFHYSIHHWKPSPLGGVRDKRLPPAFVWNLKFQNKNVRSNPND